MNELKRQNELLKLQMEQQRIKSQIKDENWAGEDPYQGKTYITPTVKNGGSK